MEKIIECVPNFSEGRDTSTINKIAEAISNTVGCTLVDVDAGASTNRTVYTFFGSPEAIVDGALNGALEASKHINMKSHTGSHPRLGALDVCPFIPIKGVTMDDCVSCAKRFSEKLVEHLNVPVYLYGHAATEDYRKTVPDIRKGQYEHLPEKIKDEKWQPDYGPAEFMPEWGASIVGARDFLIALNVNIMGTVEQAQRIAFNIRTSGRGAGQPGLLDKIQAVGWYEEQSKFTQVSINVLDYKTTSVHVAHETVVDEAKKLKLAVAGSQIVGLVPLQVMLDAADYYIKIENLFIVDEDQKIKLVVDRLGLHSTGQFNPKEKIIEYVVDANKKGPLISMCVVDFVHSLGSRTPSPGGGSAAAAVASIGAALSLMVGWMTYGKKKFEDLDGQLRTLIPPIHQAMTELLPLVDADTCAFDAFMSAMKLPKKTPEEKERRAEAMEAGICGAINVPLRLIEIVTKIWDPLVELAKCGNISTKSDIQVGVKCLETGVWGAYYNVLINLSDVKDEAYAQKVKGESEEGLTTAKQKSAEILEILDKRDS